MTRLRQHGKDLQKWRECNISRVLTCRQRFQSLSRKLLQLFLTRKKRSNVFVSMENVLKVKRLAVEDAIQDGLVLTATLL